MASIHGNATVSVVGQKSLVGNYFAMVAPAPVVAWQSYPNRETAATLSIKNFWTNLTWQPDCQLTRV